MKDKDLRDLDKRRRRIAHRLNGRRGRSGQLPVLNGGRPRYAVGDRVCATAAGGVGAIHALVRALELPQALDEQLVLLKRHLPYHESDHILALAYSVLAGGTRLQDLDRLREDEAFMEMLGARRLPDPTTAGDFLRRFAEADVRRMQAVINEHRAKIWRLQPPEFRAKAVIDVDGSVAPTTGEKKRDMDFCFHKKLWGYHPLLVSLQNTREPLFIENRPGNVPSHKGSVAVIDEAIALVEPIFEEVLLRGDTDFSLTANFDRWTEQGVHFVFGFDAIPKLKGIAESLAPEAWQRLDRKPKYEVETSPRAQRENVKDEKIEAKGWKNIVLEAEHFAEFDYQPTKCARPYRIVVLRKSLKVTKGQLRLLDECRYFFYVTNDSRLTTQQVIRESNERCDQENLIAQLKSGVNALHSPSHDLLSNWAYMVIAALAWTFKAWFGLTLPRTQDRLAIVRMEFRTFLRTVVLIPAQVARSGRRLIVRLLAFTSRARLLFRSMQQSAALGFT